MTTPEEKLEQRKTYTPQDSVTWLKAYLPRLYHPEDRKTPPREMTVLFHLNNIQLGLFDRESQLRLEALDRAIASADWSVHQGQHAQITSRARVFHDFLSTQAEDAPEKPQHDPFASARVDASELVPGDKIMVVHRGTVEVRPPESKPLIVLADGSTWNILSNTAEIFRTRP